MTTALNGAMGQNQTGLLTGEQIKALLTTLGHELRAFGTTSVARAADRHPATERSKIETRAKWRN